MTNKLRTVLALGFLLSPVWLLGELAEKPAESPSNEILQRFDSIPLHFEENRGQLDERVSFIARGLGYQLLLTPEERIMMVYKPGSDQPGYKTGRPGRPRMPETPQAHAIRMEFEGSNEQVVVESEGELDSKMHYLRGRDRDAWVRHVSTFSKVRYKNLYDGIDVVYYGNQRQVQYDFIVQPGASFENIRMKFAGVDELKVNAAGDLVLGIPDGELVQRRPYIYQEIDGSPLQVEGEFKLVDEETVQFLVKDYDESLPLIIDPIIEYSKIFGGTGAEVSYGIQVDATGNVYLTGVTSSFDFPITQSAGNLPDVNYNGGTSDIFVSKVAPDGQSFIWSTFIGGDGQTNGSGGSGQEVAYDLALDAAGSAYVAGASASEDFPADVRYYTSAVYAEGAFSPNRHIPFPIDSFSVVAQTNLGFGTGTNSEDAIVFKLTPDGSDLAYSVILGGGSPDGVLYDYAFGVEVDSSGRAYVVGATGPIEPPSDSTGTRLFPTTDDAFSQQPHFLGSGVWDGFLSVLAADPIPAFAGDTSGLEYSTYISGGGDDYLYEVAVDDSNLADVSIWATGTSNSFDTNFEFAAPFPVIVAPILVSSLDDETFAPFVEDSFRFLSTNPFDDNYNGEFDSFALEVRPTLAPTMSDAPPQPVLETPLFELEGFTIEQALINYEADLDAYATALDSYGTDLTAFDGAGSLGSPAHWEFELPEEVPSFEPGDPMNPTPEETAIENAEAAANAAYNDVVTAYFTGHAIHKIVFEDGQIERLASVTYSTWLGGGPRGTPNGGDGDGGIGEDGLVPSPGGQEFDGNDIGYDIALDSTGIVHIVGSTSSSDFPTSDLAFLTKFGGALDGWIFKLDPTQVDNNDQMIYSTYLAGRVDDVVQSVIINADDEAIVTGFTASEDFPASSNAFDISPNGARDVFLTHLSADGSTLAFSTFLGGFNNDEGNKVALNNSFDTERIFVTGYTNSGDFFTTVDELASPADRFYIRGVDTVGNTIDIAPELSAGFVTQYDLSQPTPVDNDFFENRRFLGGFKSLIVGNTEAATFEVGEPDHAGIVGGKSVWFSWTSVAVGDVVISTEGSSFDTLLSVYTGPSFANFEVVSNSDDKDGTVTWSEVRFPVNKGDIYSVAVDGKGGVFGDYKFKLSFETFNDLFSYTQDTGEYLTFLEHHEDSSNVTATREGSEPNHAAASVGKSIWWSWRAPTTGTVEITADAATVQEEIGWEPIIAVYSGVDLSSIEPTLVGDNVIGVETDPQTGQPVVIYTGNQAVRFVALRDVVYRIAVDGPVGAVPSEGNITLNIIQEYNDLFTDAEDLADNTDDQYTILTQGDNYNATQEPLEPQHGGNAGGKSVWWKWTAPADGLVNLKTYWDSFDPISNPNSYFDTVLAVYLGENINNLQEVRSDNDSGPNGTSEVNFLAIGGTTYWIAVDGVFDGSTTTEGDIRLQLNLLPQNDLFENASVIAGTSLSVTGFNLNASEEAGEPEHAGDLGGQSVWWRWTAPSDGQVIIDTSGSDFDTVLGVYTGDTLGGLLEIDSNDNYTSPDLASQVVFDGLAGVEYLIAVDGTNDAGEISEGQVTMSLTTRTDNNDLLQAFVLTGFVDGDEGNNSAADLQPGEPDHAGVPGGKSLWWTWVAASTGPVDVSTEGSSVDTALAVYTGDSIPQLSLVSSNDNYNGNTYSRVRFTAIAGERYRFAIDGKNGASGLLKIQLNMPANNDLVDALVLNGTLFEFVNSTFNADMEAGEPSHSTGEVNVSGGSVWYSWRAPDDGIVNIDVSAQGTDIGVAAYVGDNFIDFDTGQLAVGVNKIISFPVAAGQDYFIAVRGQSTTFDFQMELVEAAIVGTFGGAIPLDGFLANSTQNNNNAFKEPGEPLHAGNSGGRSVWFAWVAPASGNLTASTVGSDFDTLLAVYQGTGFNNLLALASNDDFPPDVTSQVTLPVVAGGTYRIAVDGKYDLLGNTIASGNVQLSLSLAPSNDLLAKATVVTGGSLLIEGFNNNAGKEIGESDHAGNSGGRSVWFDYVAPADGMVVVDTVGSEFDTLLAVYTGNAVGALSNITANDNLGGTIFSSRVVVLASAGESYKIAVDGKDGAFGNFTIGLFMVSENDDFADRINLSGTFANSSGVTDFATHEFGEPIHAGNVGGRSIWWEWTAPANGRLDLDTSGSNFDTLLSLYIGDVIDDLTEIASNDNAEPGKVISFLSTPVVSGTTYKIAVDGKLQGEDLARGIALLNLGFTSAPANDNFANALDLVGTDANDAANNYAASSELNEVFSEFDTLGRSVWWKWTAPAQGQLAVDTSGSDFDTILAVVEGTSVDDLTVVGFNDNALGEESVSSLAILVNGGTTYHILVDGTAGDDVGASTGNVKVNLSFTNATTGGGPFEPADKFSDAVGILGYGFNLSTTNATATQESLEPLHGSNPGGKSIWFEWLAPATGLAVIDTAGSNFDSLLAIYTGDTLGDLVEIVSNDNVSGGDPTSKVQFIATAGTRYLIAVDGHFDSVSGTTDAGLIDLNLSLLPSNDNFDRAAPVGTGSFSFASFNFNASKQAGEPNHGGNAGGSSIWWKWQAQTDVLVSVDTAGSVGLSGDPLDTLLGVYTGETVDALTLVAENDNYSSPDGASQVSFLAAAGESYYFAIDGKSGGGDADEGSVFFNFVLIETNNLFGSPSTIVGYDPGVIFGSNEGADKEAGEPEHAGDAGGSSVWWSWVAPQTGPVAISTRDSVIDTLLAVYTGQSLAGLNLVAENDNVTDGVVTSSVSFNAVQGTEYQIAVDGKAGASGGIQLHLKSPANDDLADAILLSGPEIELVSHNFETTIEVNEPNHLEESAGRSVWWKWFAPKDGRVTVSTSGSNFDTILAIYAGTSLETLALIAGEDDGENGKTSTVSFNAANGSQYYILVDGSDDVLGSEETDFVGEIHLSLILERERVVGSFSGGDILAGTSVSVTGNNTDAFQEPGEPQHAGNAGGKSLWYTWTAPQDGTLFLDTSGSAINTLLGVYEGNSVDTLTQVGSNDDVFPGNQTSAVAVGVLAGSTYHIAVDGFFDPVSGITEAGSINLNLTLGATNNDFINAVPLNGSKGTFTSFVNNADAELAEPFHAGRAATRSVWWRFSPDINGIVIVDTAGSDFDTVLAVYRGTAMNNLVSVPNGANDNHTSPDLTSQVVFEVSAGSVYYIAVDAVSLAPDQGKVFLSFSAVGSSGGDAFAACGELNGYSDSSSASNQFATRQSGEPMHAGKPGGKSVWWCWTAPGNGVVRITTEDSTISTLIGAYIGPEVTSLIAVSPIEDPQRLDPSKLTFEATKGTTYRIAVDGAVQNGVVDSGIIFIQVGLSPENDKFEDLFNLGSGTNIIVTGTNFNATLQDGEPVHGGLAGGKSVWWSWSPSIKGNVVIDTQGSSFDTTLGVYRGAGLKALTEIGGNDDAGEGVSYSRLEFLALPGRTYHIAVDGDQGDEGDVVLRINQVPIDEVELVNVSTRGWVGVDQETMIAGFIVLGDPGESSRVIIRALGNSLVQGGVSPSSVVPDPDLILVGANNNIIAQNKQWINGPSPALIAEFGLAPIDPNEAVIIVDLLPGAYTANVNDSQGRSGIGLVEVYYVEDENSGGAASRLINISTRSLTGTGDQQVIGGFVISGSRPKQVLIRGIGPSLGAAGVANALSDTMLKLFSAGSEIASNNDWQSASNSSQVTALLPPGNAKESAILVTLDPGAYTAILSGVGGSTGIGLIEIYEVTP